MLPSSVPLAFLDLRALSEADVAELKQKLNSIRNREEPSPAEKVHPKLDWANVRAHYDDVLYCGGMARPNLAQKIVPPGASKMEKERNMGNKPRERVRAAECAGGTEGDQAKR